MNQHQRQPNRREFLRGLGVAALTTTPLTPTASQAQTEAGLAYQTAGQLVAALAARKVSSVELTEQAIKRIEALDGKTNAVVVRDFERARAAAAAADAALARGERAPLLGLPMTVKESFNVAGLPTTWGIPQAKDYRATQDAAAVERLKAAGAITLGKTNVPRILADWQSYNEIYGTTNNPWDLTRTPGGSSGGSAAALAAGYTALELGSDVGGSLRAPAHCCGVYGHKPSRDIVPLRGQVPPGVPSLPLESPLVVAGPMARSAVDLEMLLDVIAGPDEPAAVAYRLTLPPPRHEELKRFRVLVFDTHPLLPAGREVRGAIDAFAGALVQAGATVARESRLMPDLAASGRAYAQLLTSLYAPNAPSEVYARMQQAAAALPADDQSLAAVRTRAFTMSHRDWFAADRARFAVSARWRELFRAWDIVVFPAMSTPAFPHDHSPQPTRRIDIDGTSYSYNDHSVWAGMATLAGLPATAFPIARSARGLPIGVQAIGPFLEDRTPLRFAQLVEREFGGFVPPPGFGS